MAFVADLVAYGDHRVAVRPQDSHGLLDLPAALGTARRDTVVYCCGPEPLINAVEQHCVGWPTGALRVERFRAADGALNGPLTTIDVVVGQSGEKVTVGPDESIVEALARIGVLVPTSCGEGTCGTCETKIIEGIPDHRDSLLSDEEQEENEVMMLCCSRALTPALVLDL